MRLPNNRKILYYLFFIVNFLTFLALVYTKTKFKIIFGSDDGILFHILHNFNINKTLPLGPTMFTLIVYLFTKLARSTNINFLNSFIILVNIISVVTSSIFISKIVKKLTKNTLVSLFSIPLFLFCSSVIFTYITRWVPYLPALMFSVLSFYYFLLYYGQGKFKYVFLSLFFAQITFLLRRIWQPFALFIAIFIAIEIIKKKKYKQFLFIFISNFLLFLPWLIWRVKNLGKFFYVDEYKWVFDKEIMDVYYKVLWNPKPSFNLLVTYFSPTSYPIFGNSMFYLLMAATVFIVSLIVFNKIRENKIIYIWSLFLFWFFLLLVDTKLIRPSEGYSSPGFPFLIIILCFLLLLIFQIFKSKKSKLFFALLIYIIILIKAFDSVNYIFKNYESSKRYNLSFQKDASNISMMIDKNSSILFRSYFIEPSLYGLEDKGTILSIFDLEKGDAIDYLSWENDPLGILRKYNIKYVFEYKNNHELEYGYYPWLKETYNKDLQYLNGLNTDNRVIKIYDGVSLVAYEVFNN
jgi:hypothetical protein